MKTREVRQLVTEGITKREIAQRLGISERSVYRMCIE
jgi:DNA-binding CsgD family transcriptional regulator